MRVANTTQYGVLRRCITRYIHNGLRPRATKAVFDVPSHVGQPYYVNVRL